MKKTIFILSLFILCLLTINAQPYKSILSNGTARWSIVILYGYEANEEWITGSIVTINDTKYKSLCKYSTMYPPNYTADYLNNFEQTDIFWKEYTPNDQHLCEKYYLRESHDTSKLYVYESSENVK